MLRIFESSFDAIEPDLRRFYVEDAERGGFKLDCNIDDVDQKLLKALRAERQMRGFYKRQLREVLPFHEYARRLELAKEFELMRDAGSTLGGMTKPTTGDGRK